MANRNLFGSIAGTLLPKPEAVNEAGGPAYTLGAKHALAQYLATGCLNATFYANAEEQLRQVMLLSAGLEAEFIAKAAIFVRERGQMKDTPALLSAILAGTRHQIARGDFSARHRQREDAAHLRADHPLRSDGTEIARQRAQADGARLAGRAQRGARSSPRRSGSSRPWRHNQDGASEDRCRKARGSLCVPDRTQRAARSLPELVRRLRGVRKVKLRRFRRCRRDADRVTAARSRIGSRSRATRRGRRHG